MPSPPASNADQVRKRLIFYVPGFDPMPPIRYRELYRMEGVAQSKISDHQIQVDRMSTLEGVPRFGVEARIEGQEVHSEFRFLTWNDLVFATMNVPIWKSWLEMFRIGRIIAGSGALRALMRLHFPANLAGLYPFIFIPLQLIGALLIGLLLGAIFASFIPPSLGPASEMARYIVALGVFAAITYWWRKRDGKVFAYYMLHDLSFICKEEGYTPPELRDRLEDFKAGIDATNLRDFDEVLIIGHSSGAHLAVMLLAELIREKRIEREDNLCLLTIGQDIPLVSYLPGARDLRLALFELANQDVADWVDFSAPSDGACFALCHAVKTSIDIEGEAKYPRVLSAAFSNTLNEKRLRELKYRFFRIHFQYLCHFDKPGIYDYFAITAGPKRLWERYGEYANSPSMKTTNFNPFHDKGV